MTFEIGCQLRSGCLEIVLKLSALGLVLLVALFAQSGYAQEAPPWFKTSFLDLRDDLAEASAADKRVVLYFHQSGCPYCKRLLETTFREPGIVDALSRRFDVIAIDIFGAREVLWSDGEPRTEKAFASHMKVHATPTLLFLDDPGAVAFRVEGYSPPEEFSETLRRLPIDHKRSR